MSKSELNCSFCGRSKSDTNLLIAGLDAHICDRCISQANGIIQEETTDKVNKNFDFKNFSAGKPSNLIRLDLALSIKCKYLV